MGQGRAHKCLHASTQDRSTGLLLRCLQPTHTPHTTHQKVQPVAFCLHSTSHCAGCVMLAWSCRRLVPATSTPYAHQSEWSISLPSPAHTHTRMGTATAFLDKHWAAAHRSLHPVATSSTLLCTVCSAPLTPATKQGAVGVTGTYIMSGPVWVWVRAVTAAGCLSWVVHQCCTAVP